MPLGSVMFFLFLGIVVPGYFVLRTPWKCRWLLAASIVFYASFDLRFLVLIIISTLVNYLSSIWNAKHFGTSRKAYLVLAIAFNLAVLGLFKYAGFLVELFCSLLKLAGINVHTHPLQLLLPIGLSFVTFQMIAYQVDTYRGVMPPCRRLSTFLLFTFFFPYVLAGPIPRGSQMIPQFENLRSPRWQELREGTLLLLIGIFKKVGVADAIAPYVNVRFQFPGQCGGVDLLFSVFLYSIEIYCDFSGYSDIARGIGRMLGFDIVENFRQPYLSRSITEFWQRWHVSLSAWLRDYIYLPLNFSFLRRFPDFHLFKLTEEYWSYICSTMITMGLCGLWHGPRWTYVFWGILQGIFLSAHRIMLRIRRPTRKSIWLFRPPMIATIKGVSCFALVSLMWIPFRSDNFSVMREYILGIVQSRSAGAVEMASVTGVARFAILVLLVAAIDISQMKKPMQFIVRRVAWPLKAFAYAFVIVVLFVLGGVDAEVPFIYLQF